MWGDLVYHYAVAVYAVRPGLRSMVSTIDGDLAGPGNPDRPSGPGQPSRPGRGGAGMTEHNEGAGDVTLLGPEILTALRVRANRAAPAAGVLG